MPQESKARTILFLTNKELGQATVILAVAHEFLIRQSYAVHIASFPGLETAVFQLNAQATATYKSTSSTALTSVGYASTATFHALPGPNMTQAVTGSKPYSSWFATHEIGFFGAQRAYGPLCTFAAPWSGDDHVACFKRCVEIIKQVEPGIVVVEPLLAMGIDACRTLGVKYAMLSPNSVKDHVVQANLGNLWKYPVICSGYTYPLPWKHILPNAYLAICAGVALARSPSINAINERRHAEGIKGPYPIMSSMDENPAPVLMASREETDYPSFVPDHITRCGPILRPCGSVSEERSELAKWLAQRPTVLINLGSNVCFNSEQARKFAIGLRVLLNARPDNQALWKLKPDRATEAADWIPSALKCIMDEVTDGTGHVCCMVHHGGANSYNEAVRAGVPQIVLPVWFDTYDYASRVEYLGIGVWGSKPSAPAINGPELGKAFIRVLHSEESSTMRQKAKVIASKLQSSEGRIVACEKLIELMEQ